jgi:saccharopine dehydrogenase-like NADP-dependent oxidoreductase
MHTILVAGAGKSSGYLIDYLLGNASRYKWKVVIADAHVRHLHDKLKSTSYGEAVETDITDADKRAALVQRADFVVSLLPPALHILVARDCLKYKRSLITSSYMSDEMQALDAEVKEAGLMFMCEMGLDPGIDHMTASKIIHSIQRVAGSITSFKSYCGGLIAPESDNNPWHYKFTWNPMNVVVAGKGGAKYLAAGKQVEVPYEKMFELTKKVKIGDVGSYAFYPNRDSYRYLDLYDVPEIKTFLRATLRHASFLKGWNAVVLLGLTREDDRAPRTGLTHAEWLRSATSCGPDANLASHVAAMLGVPENDKSISLLSWLGLFNNTPIADGVKTSAEILLDILQSKWGMAADDKDMVLMQHEFEYNHKGRKVKLTSTMSVIGEGRDHSAMAKTVGLPMGILAKLVLTGKIHPPTGVVIPTMPAVYRPVLTELGHFGIVFTEEVD